MPCMGPASTPAAKAASAACASASARSAVTVMKLSIAGSIAAIRPSASCVSAVEVKVPALRAAPASAMESSCNGFMAQAPFISAASE